jgi:hypothetical protein
VDTVWFREVETALTELSEVVLNRTQLPAGAHLRTAEDAAFVAARRNALDAAEDRLRVRIAELTAQLPYAVTAAR